MEGRYELKFMITSSQRDTFLQAAEGHLVPDPHGENARYRITSQYYDAPDMASYWAKIDGVGRRKKIRMRYYGSPSTEAVLRCQDVFIEIKHRLNACVFKERARLPGDAACTIMTNPELLADLCEKTGMEDDIFLKKMEKLSRVCWLQAANVISYNRIAWLGVHDHRLRVTFDSEIEAFPPDQFVPNLGSGSPLLSPESCIMEIKFNRVIPTWVKECIVLSNAQMQRFSKYAHAIEALHLVSQQTTD